MRKAAIALSVVVLAAAFFYMTRDRSYDRSFDTRVANPAYPTAGGGPVVLYDEGHLNTHTTTTGYKPFADLVRNDGYTLRTTDQPFTLRQLGGIAVLVLVLKTSYV